MRKNYKEYTRTFLGKPWKKEKSKTPKENS